jgi:hypothetical protein
MSDGALDLYVLLDGQTVGYQTVQPAGTGCAFELLCDVAPVSGARKIRVELVHGATVWYRWEGEL